MNGRFLPRSLGRTPGQIELVQSTADGTLLDRLLHMDVFQGHLRRLGRHHAELGVLSDHYGPTGIALVHALRTALGSRFKADVEAAWVAL